jgi:DNA-binding transcriptional ArsR family regulator
MFAALGAEPRLEIMRLLLSAHPEGMVVGDIQAELGIPNSTLSHHLEKLRIEGLVEVRKERQFLWYSANAAALQDLLGFLYSECCTRSRVVEPVTITSSKVRK